MARRYEQLGKSYGTVDGSTGAWDRFKRMRPVDPVVPSDNRSYLTVMDMGYMPVTEGLPDLKQRLLARKARLEEIENRKKRRLV